MSNEIFTNETEIRKRIKEAEEVLPIANKAMKLFTDEGIKPTNDHFKGFYKGGAEYLIGCLGKIARAEIEKMNISLDRLKQSFLRDSTAIDEAKVSKIHAELYRAMGSSKVSTEDLEIDKSAVRISKAFIESINEQFTVKLDTPAKKEMWEAIQNFCTAFSAMEAIAERTGILSLQETLDVDKAHILIIKKEGAYARAEPDPSFFLGFQGTGKLIEKQIRPRK